ncbi:MAG: hypothetical protein ACK4UP_12260 [Spirosomataceae bacterium]
MSSSEEVVINPHRNKKKGGKRPIEVIEISSDEEPTYKRSRNTVAKRTYNPKTEGTPIHKNPNPRVGMSVESNSIEEANYVDQLFKVRVSIYYN